MSQIIQKSPNHLPPTKRERKTLFIVATLFSFFCLRPCQYVKQVLYDLRNKFSETSLVYTPTRVISIILIQPKFGIFVLKESKFHTFFTLPYSDEIFQGKIDQESGNLTLVASFVLRRGFVDFYEHRDTHTHTTHQTDTCQSITFNLNDKE